MAVIYRKTDKIKIRVGSVDDSIVLHVSPLSQHEKSEIQSLMLDSKNKDSAKHAMLGITKTLRYSIKQIDGLKDSDGYDYALEFKDGMLTEDCVNDIMNLELSPQIMFVCSNLVNNIPKQFLDDNGKPLPDVEILKDSTGKKPIEST